MNRAATTLIALASVYLAACVGAPGQATFSSPAGQSATSPTPAYIVDERIAGLYGVAGDVAWMLNPGRRPGIALVGEQEVEFVHGTTPERVDAFAQAFGGRVVRRIELPARPDGLVPATATNRYRIVFEPTEGPMDDLAQLMQELGAPRPVIFSSERAARVFHKTLRAKRGGYEYGMLSFGLNYMSCIPEDCGVAPGDPYAGGASTHAPAGTLRNDGGPVGPLPEASPEPHSHVTLAGGRGQAYVLGNVLYLVAPGEQPKALIAWAERTSLVLVDPKLRFVLLHERLPELLDVPAAATLATPMAVTTKPQPGSRLVLQPLDQGEKKVLIAQFHDYALDAALAPDGRTLAVRTVLERSATGGDTRRLYLLDLEAAAPEPRPWLGAFTAYNFKWAPVGLRLAMSGASSDSGKEGLYVASPGDAAAELLIARDEGGLHQFDWLPDGKRLFATWSQAKYEGVVHAAIVDADTGAIARHDYPIQPGEVHIEVGRLSPDGTRLLVPLIPKGSGASRWAVITLATGAWSRLAGAASAPHWNNEGSLVCQEANDQGEYPCALE